VNSNENDAPNYQSILNMEFIDESYSNEANNESIITYNFKDAANLKLLIKNEEPIAMAQFQKTGSLSSTSRNSISRLIIHTLLKDDVTKK
jgi:hypothetical protein